MSGGYDPTVDYGISQDPQESEGVRLASIAAAGCTLIRHTFRRQMEPQLTGTG